MKEAYKSGKKKLVEISYDPSNNCYLCEGSINLVHHGEKILLIKQLKSLGYKKVN